MRDANDYFDRQGYASPNRFFELLIVHPSIGLTKPRGGSLPKVSRRTPFLVEAE